MPNPDLDELQTRINKLKESNKPQNNRDKKTQDNLNLLIIATELVAGVIIGLISGLFFDKLFDSKPIFLIINLLLGVVAGAKNVWRRITTKN